MPAAFAPYTPLYSRADASIYTVSALGAALILVIAWYLEPSSAGVGTHTQLGLPACRFLELTGIPCPSCGLTTCFALAAKFHFIQAAIVQPFGLLQFFLTIFSIPGVLMLKARRVPIDRFVMWPATTRAVWIWTTLLLLGWAYKIWSFRA